MPSRREWSIFSMAEGFLPLREEFGRTQEFISGINLSKSNQMRLNKITTAVRALPRGQPHQTPELRVHSRISWKGSGQNISGLSELPAFLWLPRETRTKGQTSPEERVGCCRAEACRPWRPGRKEEQDGGTAVGQSPAPAGWSL